MARPSPRPKASATSEPTTSDKVQARLEGDVVLAGALSRGILNLRRAARWLIDENGWDASEEAVVSALRRRRSKVPEDRIDRGFEMLRRTEVRMRTELSLWTFPAREDVPERVQEVLETQDLPALLSVTQKSGTVTYVVREPPGENPWRDHDEAPDRIHPVTEVRSSLSRGEPEAGYALGSLLHTLARRGIPILDVSSTGNEQSILVPGSFTHVLHGIVMELRGNGGDF